MQTSGASEPRDGGHLLSQLAEKYDFETPHIPQHPKVGAPRIVGTSPYGSGALKPSSGYGNAIWHCVVKFVEDKFLGAMLLLAVGPLFAMIAVLIKIDSRGPVFFVQRRFGYKSSVIQVIKFRTMHVDRGDPSGAQRTIPNDPRVTRLGRILRLFSLDELPQLINVVRGDMSLIGPRPHAVAMKAGDRLYCEAVEHYHLRHNVKPGITGWAQVNGLRGEVDTLDKARARVTCDLHYIERWSAWLDLKIVLKTAALLFYERAY